MNRKKFDDFMCELYRDWFNNFLSIEGFSSHYGLPENLTIKLLTHAEMTHHLHHPPIKPTERTRHEETSID